MIRNFSKIRSLRQFTVDSQEVQIVTQTARPKVETGIEFLTALQFLQSFHF